jgi:ketosteroid isomerase-like protein
LLSPTEVVAAFNATWAAGDIAAALSYVAEDAVYELHISGELVSSGGVTEGRDNIGAVLRKLRAEFEYILYRPFPLNSDGESVRFQVEFMYRHRASGEVLTGRFRQVVRVRDGAIARVDEYHDRAKVEAFMRLVGGFDRH